MNARAKKNAMISDKKSPWCADEKDYVGSSGFLVGG